MREWMDMVSTPTGLTIRQLGCQVGLQLRTEISEDAIGELADVLEEEGVVVLYQSEGGRYVRSKTERDTGSAQPPQKGTRLGEYRIANEKWLYAKRSGASESAKDCSKQWKDWVTWVDAKIPGALLGRYLQLVPRGRKRDEWATAYLAERIRLGLVEEQVTALLSRLRSQFRNHNRMREVESWYGKSIEDAQKSAARENRQVRDILREKKAKEVYDVNFRIIHQAAVNTGALNDDWSEKGMTAKLGFLGLSGSFEFGFRPSNAVGTGKAGDMGHAWILSDCKLITRTTSGGIFNLHMGLVAQRSLATGQLPKGRVLQMEVGVPTSKTGRKARIRDGPKIQETATLGRRTELESWYLDFWLEFFIQNGPRAATEPILIRRAFTGPGDSGRELTLRSKELVETLRTAAGTLGLPRINFTGRSVRKGYAITARDQRVTLYRKLATDAMMTRGNNWAAGSTVPDKHYLYDYEKVGPFGLMANWQQAAEFSIEQYLIRAPGLYDEELDDMDDAIWADTT